MKFGVVIFPGSNCDADTHDALEFLGQDVSYVWHQETDVSGFDCLVLPGGFSYGDYLRCGAVARLSPVMGAIKRFAGDGGLVAGICNGFQILLEAGLLPGAMLVNKNLKFLCKYVNVRVETAETPFTNLAAPGEVLSIPIAHFEGNYFADEETLSRMKANDQVVLRYCTPEGEVTPAAAPNGALDNIAGICNETRNVFGMMPHPERCCEDVLGSTDGRRIFESIASARLVVGAGGQG
ncbi:MAG: phosphoribosylformylglycinamidine synthase subunit PurQ [Actinobacteria bacterium]|nr:MAG: phosphoribosylformylglycinamidine synthase subunit PurQ [Actinomycetota bacterium]